MICTLEGCWIQRQILSSVSSFCFSLRVGLLHRVKLCIQVIGLALLFDKLLLDFVFFLMLCRLILLGCNIRSFNKLQTKSTLLASYSCLHSLKQRFANLNLFHFVFKLLVGILVHWALSVGIMVEHLLCWIFVENMLQLFAWRHRHGARLLTVHGGLDVRIGVRYLNMSFHSWRHC